MAKGVAGTKSARCPRAIVAKCPAVNGRSRTCPLRTLLLRGLHPARPAAEAFATGGSPNRETAAHDLPNTASEFASTAGTAAASSSSATRPICLVTRGIAVTTGLGHGPMGASCQPAVSSISGSACWVRTTSTGVKRWAPASHLHADRSRVIGLRIPRNQAAAVRSGIGDGILDGHSGQPREPRVGTGVTDVDHQMRTPAGTGEELLVHAGLVETRHGTSGKPSCAHRE